jgi:hypothetical protein
MRSENLEQMHRGTTVTDRSMVETQRCANLRCTS